MLALQRILPIDFWKYFSKKGLLSSSSMRICKVLLKHDLDNFSLSILEYCEPGQCLEREDYYIKLLKPEYNILQKAGSSLGIKR